MCYDIKASLEAQLKRAKRYNNVSAILEIEQKLLPFTDLPLHHASGFNHPKVLVYTQQDPKLPIIAHWGLIPHWVQSKEQKQKLWNSTINARLETLYEKPSFRDAAKSRRCLLYVDGFFEHHHANGNSYPFFVQRKDHEPLCIAGIWTEWVDTNSGEIIPTFAMVTVKGEGMMARLHNSPKLKEPRMPLVLKDEAQASRWLKAPVSVNAINNANILEDNVAILKAYPVARLRGKAYLGNIPEVSEPFDYPELSLNF